MSGLKVDYFIFLKLLLFLFQLLTSCKKNYLYLKLHIQCSENVALLALSLAAQRIYVLEILRYEFLHFKCILNIYNSANSSG